MKVKIRSLIAAPPGKILLAADLSQAESWIVAYLSGSERMKNSLNFSDIHSDTAVALFHPDYVNKKHEWKGEGKNKRDVLNDLLIVETERYIGKQNNHANSYGQGPYRMTETINKQSDKPPYVTVSIEECKIYQETWHGFYPEVRDVFQRNIEEQLYKNRTLITPYGFKRTFYGHLDDHLIKSAYAFVPQSTVCYHFAGAVQKELGVEGGLKKIHEELCNNEIFIINMSHDSLVIELPEHLVDEIAPQVYSYLKRPMVINGEEFTIPVDVEIGYNYGEMKEWKSSSKLEMAK